MCPLDTKWYCFCTKLIKNVRLDFVFAWNVRGKVVFVIWILYTLWILYIDIMFVVFQFDEI